MTYENLTARPAAFASLSGLTLADFDALFHDFAAAYAKDRQQSLTRKGQPRRRAAGAGAKFSQDGRTRLLVALVWLRTYPTYEVLAFLFSLNKTNAQRGTRDVRVRTARQRKAKATLGEGHHGRLPRCAPGH